MTSTIHLALQTQGNFSTIKFRVQCPRLDAKLEPRTSIVSIATRQCVESSIISHKLAAENG